MEEGNKSNIGNPIDKRFCSQYLEIPSRLEAFNVGGDRQRIILLNLKKWLNGSTITFHFVACTPEEAAAVRLGFEAWKSLGIGLKFQETQIIQEAMIRIGFEDGHGSWSYVGRDALDVPNPMLTMNFGWDITNDPGTILHEIGHMLGLMHEHQNPNAGIVWDEPRVYAALAAAPNYWSQATTYHNIIKKLAPSEVNGSTHDPNSIMHYEFGRGLIKSPTAYQNGIYPPGTLSALDREFVQKYYPIEKREDYKRILVGRRQFMNLKNGEQVNYVFKPIRTRKYNIHTSGDLDTVMVLFEKTADAGEVTIAGDDNSGRNENARIVRELEKGKEYIIRIRLFHVDQSGSPSLIIT